MKVRSGLMMLAVCGTVHAQEKVKNLELYQGLENRLDTTTETSQETALKQERVSEKKSAVIVADASAKVKTVTAKMPATGMARLRDVVLQALETHPQIKKLERDRDAAGEDIDIARAGLMPTLDLNGSVGFENSQNTTTEDAGYKSRTLDRYDTSVVVRQLLFDGGETFGKIDRSEAIFDRSEFSIKDGEESLALRTVVAYLDVLRARRQIKLSKENIKAHDEILQTVKHRFKNNLVPEADVIQVEGRLSLARAELVRDKNDLKRAEVDFYETTGTDPKELKEPGSPSGSLPIDLVDAEKTTAEEHPAIKANLKTIEAVEASIDEVSARFSPRLHLELTGSENQNQGGSKSNSDNYSAMAVMTFNLFNGGADKSTIEREEMRLAKETEQLAETKRSITRDVSHAWYLYESKIEEIKFFQSHLRASERAYEAFKSQYEMGKQRTLFDLLNARSEYFNSRFKVVDTEYALKSSEFRILAAMGQLVPYFENSY